MVGGIYVDSIVDSTDTKFLLIKNPKIVSLSPYVTENLFDLGSEKNVVGVTNYCNRPKAAEQKTKIGGIVNLNVEAILKLNPDLIIATKEDQNFEQIKRLRDLGLKVFVLQEVKSYDDIKQNFLTISVLVDKKNLAVKKLSTVQKKLDFIMQKNLNRKTQKIFFIIEADPIITVGKNSFINDTLKFLNAENIVNIQNPRYPIFSKEKILELTPKINAIIFLSESKKTSGDNVKFFENIKSQKFNVNPDVFSRASLKAFYEAVNILDEKLK